MSTVANQRQKSAGYTLEVADPDGDGFVHYLIRGPRGEVYGAGKRKGDLKTVGNHYQKTVNRLNASAGFRSIKWGRVIGYSNPAARE